MSEGAAICANCGLNSCCTISASTRTSVSYAYSSSRSVAVDDRTHEVRLDLGERALRADRVAGAAEQTVDRREHDRERELQDRRARQRVQRQDDQVRRVRQRADVLVVRELLDRSERAVRARAQRRREHGRELPRERLVHDLERAHVIAAELVRAPEVERNDVRLPPAPLARSGRRHGPSIGPTGPELRASDQRFARSVKRARSLHHEVGEVDREDLAVGLAADRRRRCCSPRPGACAVEARRTSGPRACRSPVLSATASQFSVVLTVVGIDARPGPAARARPSGSGRPSRLIVIASSESTGPGRASAAVVVGGGRGAAFDLALASAGSGFGGRPLCDAHRLSSVSLVELGRRPRPARRSAAAASAGSSWRRTRRSARAATIMMISFFLPFGCFVLGAFGCFAFFFLAISILRVAARARRAASGRRWTGARRGATAR